jgi:tetratricopeptide (TPR) repeat protein
MATDPMLFDSDFQTGRPSNPLYCHTDFLEKLSDYRTQPLAKRAALLLQRLAVDERRLHYKATHGANRGWRRSRLGGTGGNQFYAWWAPRLAPPLRNAPGFDDAPEGALFLRDIRHHDDHSPLLPHSFGDNYLAVTVPEIRRQEYSPEPWTGQQARFAKSRHPVRLLKGHPGSGKTTALLHAADSTNAERTLYVTYSPELAAMGRDYFERYCSASRRFHVATFGQLVRQWLDVADPPAPDSVLRRRFQGDLHPFQRHMGPWSDNPQALYEEFHAHLVGSALPVAIGRFGACAQPRAHDRQYLQRRDRFLGPAAARSAIDLATRLEKAARESLAARYFTELELAWRAATGDVPEPFLSFDCIAVDECQDLTPLESFLLVKLATAIRDRRNRLVPILLAGDEAQTVRPTDFEWGWLNDLFHASIGTPSEFKLSSNLRSPRRIADLVNRVWDLYAHLDKKDRPSGSGYAEIDDDATDQLFYCTAVPGPDLDQLLTELAAREGLALIAFDAIPDAVPEALRLAVLTPSEAKGLDFHSVCVLDAGHQLRYIERLDSDYRPGSEIQALRKRLAIDRLRVALSRPAERLLWVDISPNDEIVRSSIDFLSGTRLPTGLSALAPAALLKMLEEEELDLEERIQRCQSDARQYLSVRPDLAWSRAQQAVALLGEEGSLASVADDTVRRAAWLTLAEICFRLAYQGQHLSPEFGRPDLFRQAQLAAYSAKRFGLAQVLGSIASIVRSKEADKLQAIFRTIQLIPQFRPELDSWLFVQIERVVPLWVELLELNSFAGNNASLLLAALPPFYEAVGIPDAEVRIERFRKRCIDMLIKTKNYPAALEVLEQLPEPQPKLLATCLEALGQHARAAGVWLEAGQLSQALDCYRAVPDFDAALALVRRIGGEHPAAASLEWVSRMKQLIAERPANFSRAMKPTEKKMLETMLEDALGAKRARPAPRKTAPTPVKRAATPRKRKPPKL